ncbi:MAG: anti-sigma factor [Renibacterium salmoninarum]|nr:anti-sigma factor [Renibacterium salmoninarum]
MSENFAEDIRSDLASGHVLELAELYALNALSDQERAEVDHFLASSAASVQAEFADRLRLARETIATAYGSVEAEPPSSLFDRISAEISAGSVPQALAEPSVAASVATEAARREAPDTETRRTGPAGVLPVPDDLAARRAAKSDASAGKRRPVRAWLIASAAAAAVVVAAALGVNGIIAAQNSPTNQVISASDVKVSTVQVQGGGDAKISVSAEKDSAVVQMSGVPAPSAGKTYQLWLLPQAGSAPISVGLMGSSTELDQPALVTGIKGAQAVAITVEPAGGSEKPTSLPVMFSKFDA